jgi:hypothetical protein
MLVVDGIREGAVEPDDAIETARELFEKAGIALGGDFTAKVE